MFKNCVKISVIYQESFCILLVIIRISNYLLCICYIYLVVIITKSIQVHQNNREHEFSVSKPNPSHGMIFEKVPGTKSDSDRSI